MMIKVTSDKPNDVITKDRLEDLISPCGFYFEKDDPVQIDIEGQIHTYFVCGPQSNYDNLAKALSEVDEYKLELYGSPGISGL